MKTLKYKQPCCDVILVKGEEPLVLSGNVGEDPIGGGGDAGSNGNPPLDAPAYENWTDVWDE